MEIKNKITKSEPVPWKAFQFIQGTEFKDLSSEAYQKLKTSLINNDFVQSFKVWENEGSVYCLDGYHRCKVLSELEKEGYNIPALFQADFIECSDRKEAAKLVLVFSSVYAQITNDGFYDFISKEELDLNEVNLEIDIPSLDLPQEDDLLLGDNNPDNNEIVYTEQYGVIVLCANEIEQEIIFNRFTNDGLKCKVVTT